MKKDKTVAMMVETLAKKAVNKRDNSLEMTMEELKVGLMV